MKKVRRIQRKRLRLRPLSLGAINRVGKVYEKSAYIVVSLSRVLVEEIEDWLENKCPECGGVCK